MANGYLWAVLPREGAMEEDGEESDEVRDVSRSPRSQERKEARDLEIATALAAKLEVEQTKN